MAVSKSRPAIGVALFYGVAFSLAVYFTFAAMQGDYGLFRRAEISAQAQLLEKELSTMQMEVARMENLTKRLSDDYLDLDLVDEQARSVLGMLRADEMVIR
jgi:cell division protein FtsB